MQARASAREHYQHAQETLEEYSMPQGRSLATSSSLTSVSSNGDHLFEKAFAARQRNASSESSSSASRNKSAYPTDTIASPSSILSAYQGPSIDQGIGTSRGLEARQGSEGATLRNASDEGDVHAPSSAADGLNDDTIRISTYMAQPTRPPRPVRPTRAIPMTPSRASLSDAGSPLSSSVETALPSSTTATSTSLSRASSLAQSGRSKHSPLSSPASRQVFLDPGASYLSTSDSPVVDMSSTSSSSSSYFFSNGESLDSVSSVGDRNSGAYPSDSHYLRNAPGLEVGGFARASTHTSNTSASDWAREREEAMKNSRSGVFDLEDELEREDSSSMDSTAAVQNLHSSQVPPHTPLSEMLNLPINTIIASPSPSSMGFGLGITSDDAIHPDIPSAPPSAFPSPAISAGYASDSFFPHTSTLAYSPLPQHPASAGPAPSPNMGSSRWNTTVPYARRNTLSSVRSVHRVPSKPLLGEEVTTKPLRHAASIASLADNREGSRSSTPSHGLNNVARSNSGAEHRTRKTRRRSPSFSAFSTSSNGHAALASLSYADAGFQSCYQASGSRLRAGSATMSEASEGSLENKLEELHLEENGDLPVHTLEKSSGSADRPRSQAVALVENGESEIVRLGQGDMVHELFIGSGTTHLILQNSGQPVELKYLLDASLPNIAQTLVVLDISNSTLSSIPESLSLCFNLEELNLSHNPLLSGTLPSFTSSLRSLRVLMADSCGMTNLPHSLAPLQQLHTLSFRHNTLRSLPSWLRHLADSLEVLLLDGNPWYGDYADLARSLVEPPASAITSTSTLASPVQHLRPTISPGLTSPSLTDLYDENVDLPSEPLPPLPTASPRQSNFVDNTSSPRSSFMSRARSYRAGLRRPSIINNADVDDSPINSLLLSDSGSRSSSLTRRASVLRPMRSMGDLAMPQPSIHSLIGSFDGSLDDLHDDFGRSTMPARPKTSTGKGMTIGEFFRNGTSEESYQKEQTSKETCTPDSNGYESVFESADDTEAVPEQAERGRKPSFFRKISMVAKERKAKMERKRSQSVVGREGDANKATKNKKGSDMAIPDMPKDISQSKLGKGRPFAPFMNEDMRSASAPAVTGSMGDRVRTTTASSADTPSPSFSPKSSFPASMKASTIGKSRPARLSKPFPAPLSTLGNNRQAKRRSYLMLNSVLPEVVSPGPLALTFSNCSTDDTTIHAKAFSSIREEDTIVMPRQQENHVEQVTASSYAANAYDDQVRAVQRKASLAPLMAYLRDLDELTESSNLSPAGGSDSPDRDSMVSVQPRMAQKKASSAAISMAASVPDRSSGYESIADSPRMASPASAQEPTKWKDNPVKRERVISEIVSSERSYLTGLQELVALYIQPASLPIRSSSSSSTGRETVIPQTERNMVFGTAESIAQYHATVFLPELEKAAVFVKNDRNSVTSLDEVLLRQAAEDVAKVFSQQVAFLKMYHSYCINFDTALDRLALWKSFQNGSTTPELGARGTTNQLTANHKKRIRDLLKTARKDSRHSQVDVQSYLLLPIQRVPRYRMLLEALLECTPDVENPALPDPTIYVALQSISELASEMNEKKRDSEGRRRLLHWQGRFGKEFKSPLVQPHRSLLKEGSMTISRIVKRSTAIVASSGEDSAEPALLQLNYLSIDTTPKQLLYILCNDILVLIIDSGHANGPVIPFTVLRLGKALGGRTDPASIFHDMLRVVDARAILYLTCVDNAQATECRDLINQQSRLNQQSLAVSSPSLHTKAAY